MVCPRPRRAGTWIEKGEPTIRRSREVAGRRDDAKPLLVDCTGRTRHDIDYFEDFDHDEVEPGQ